MELTPRAVNYRMKEKKLSDQNIFMVLKQKEIAQNYGNKLKL